MDLINKKLLFVVICIFVIALYLILKGDYVLEDKKQNNPINNMEPAQIYIDSTVETNLPINSINGDSSNFENASTNIKQKAVSICGYSIDSLKKRFTNNATKQSHRKLTDKQLKAQDMILNGCLEWFDYLNTLDNEDRDQLDVDKINSLKVVKYYLKNKSDSNTLSDARLTMDTGGDASSYSYMALNYLLLHDDEFVATIAEKLGTNDVDYIRNSHINLTQLYTCSIEPQSCSSDSFQVLNLCLTYNLSCDMTFHQHIASMVSPNQFNDLMNMVDILKVLIKQGYFSENTVLD